MQKENVHLLIVEDNSRYLDELLEWLNTFGYQDIETATNATSAIEKLNDPFDVIIADMRMEQDDSGFAILEQVQTLNLSSVVIILTANESVIDCRKAFKQGAWDYIAKGMPGNVFKVIDRSIQEAIIYLNRWGNVQNDQWIQENLEMLERDYWGQYIAVVNKTIIEAANSREELEKRIEERKLRRFITTIQKIGDFQPISELIKLPESLTHEYKSTWQWDVREGKKNENLRFMVLKTIAAFLNSEGGTLIIGVEDDGNIFGLEKDLSLLKKQNLDELELKIMDMIGSQIGKDFSQFIRIRFETIEGKDVCAIAVKKSTEPAFLKKGLEFYIRVGNSSRALNIVEFYNHLKKKE